MVAPVLPFPRILDANRNRAAEALRTLEDVARFALDAGDLAGRVKDLRHRLAAAVRALGPACDDVSLLANRDTAGDVGTALSNESERARANLPEIAAAAGSRATEALRVLEECAKAIAPSAAAMLEAIRYETYDLAATIVRRAPGARREQWRVCVLLTESLCCRPWRDIAAMLVDGGVDAIQLREKDLDGGELLARARWLVALARPRGVRVIVNDRVDVALAANADGVHVGQTDLTIRDVRRLAGRTLIVGASTHDLDEAARAADDGADYIGIGAMFPSGVKPSVAARGPALLAAAVRAHPSMPHLAIGGITEVNVGQLVVAGCRGVAVSGAACGADRPDLVVAALRRALDGAAAGAPR
jgi:thiamine-phosphate pyrophosphorylase